MSLIPRRSSPPPKRRSRAATTALLGLALGAAAAVARRAGLERLIRRPADGTATMPAQELNAADATAPAEAAGAAVPAPSNYDVGGPPSNTATHVPVPAPAVPEPIDEEAEIAAAAAEAAGIGGDVRPYASDDPLTLDDEEARPLFESGGGVSEGMEQAEGELVDAAEPSDTASPYQQQIDEVIEAQDNPLAGERGESLEAIESPLDVDQPGDDLGASVTGASSDAAQEDREEGDPDSWSERDARP